MPGALFLEGGKVNLRTIEEEDLEFLRDTINNPEVRTFLTSRKPKNLIIEEKFLRNVVSSDEDVNLAISKDEEIIGMVSLEEQKEIGVVEIGIYIDPSHQEKGYGTEAAELVIEYGFKTLNYHRIIARAYESNKGSQRVWEKLGFTKEGELREQIYRKGRREDAYIYGVLKKEWLNN